ncbi:hypothetical protein [Lacticaseibacillus paracasei]|uniref:hypothetical protein n=1 Tax=Lacticaseibacillus paracasei TaxID=1597 RepID=UPI0021A76180|nr:hypothetical protein [Lacticaseibacillus paracasei]MCT3338117.1 hypothetical protein [Lacticaseibacillus paracasei]
MLIMIKSSKRMPPSRMGQDPIGDLVQARSKTELRPEQQDVVDKTTKTFKEKYSILWNAKMRFGKTLSALKLIKKEIL